MTKPLRTYEDVLREQGKVVTDDFVCPLCEQKYPPFSFVERAPGDWVCGGCFSAERQFAEATAVPAPAPWESVAANDLRARRTQLQEQWRWAVMPDSPLTQAGQAKVMAFLKKLNTLTIDFPTPADVVWPETPTLEGSDYETNA